MTGSFIRFQVQCGIIQQENASRRIPGRINTPATLGIYLPGMTKSLILRLKPIFTDSNIHHQWYIPFHDVFHDFVEDVLDFSCFSVWAFDHEFVVYLHDERCLQVSFSEFTLYTHHGVLDDICTGSLNRHIHGFSFCLFSDDRVFV